jgi:hypothetical protein
MKPTHVWVVVPLVSPAVEHRKTNDMESFTYRGYQVCVVSDNCAWSFVARPTTPDLPILRLPASGLHVSRETAFAEAKARIDRLLEL